MEQTTRTDRIIVISQQIDDVLAGDIIDRIIAINDEDTYLSSTIKDYKSEPIEIFINSAGGSATAGFAIIGAMELSNVPIITYGMGLVASMALGIFVKGNRRMAHRLARFMYHSVSYGMEGQIKDHDDMRNEVGKLQEMYDSLFSSTNLSRSQMDEIRKGKRDYFFSANEAIEFGIADQVLGEPQEEENQSKSNSFWNFSNK
ncbi:MULTISPECIES: ATP-dependent Clp protease proteolytic subunit [Bacillus]|uniref:ATP-dependent Clp protease proteolytic subunit n=1 Tax=Bacillus TaxID=1386 RepID=UPI0015822335|nr:MULTISPECIES: ATP-dependent Clp protease proteolytic subunit [Bacillus]GIN66313.1 ATP-dependent Clp protease proteolytic subunit 2 [Bacillus sonorensis]